MKAKILKALFVFVALLIVAANAVTAQASYDSGKPPMKGEGAAAISGYTITNLHFQIGSGMREIASVEFDLDTPADQVQVSFDTAPGRSFVCRNAAENHWVCELDQVSIQEVEQVHISASG